MRFFPANRPAFQFNIHQMARRIISSSAILNPERPLYPAVRLQGVDVNPGKSKA
jgi:hypothetical protein